MPELGVDATRIEQRLIRHQEAARTLLGQGDRGREVRVNPLSVAPQGASFSWTACCFRARLPCVVHRGAEHTVGEPHVALDEANAL